MIKKPSHEKRENDNKTKIIEETRSLKRLDGQWLTFPFPFVHHQPLNFSLWPTVETRTLTSNPKADIKERRCTNQIKPQEKIIS